MQECVRDYSRVRIDKRCHGVCWFFFMLLKILFPSPFAWTSPSQPRTLSENLTSGRVGTPPKAPLPIWRPQNVQKSVCLSAQQEHSDLHNRRPTMKKMFDDDGRCAIIILLWWSPPQPGRVARSTSSLSNSIERGAYLHCVENKCFLMIIF